MGKTFKVLVTLPIAVLTAATWSGIGFVGRLGLGLLGLG